VRRCGGIDRICDQACPGPLGDGLINRFLHPPLEIVTGSNPIAAQLVEKVQLLGRKAEFATGVLSVPIVQPAT